MYCTGLEEFSLSGRSRSGEGDVQCILLECKEMLLRVLPGNLFLKRSSDWVRVGAAVSSLLYSLWVKQLGFKGWSWRYMQHSYDLC